MNLYIQNGDIAQLNINLEFRRVCIEPGCCNICLVFFIFLKWGTIRFGCQFNHRLRPIKENKTRKSSSSTTFPQE